MRSDILRRVSITFLKDVRVVLEFTRTSMAREDDDRLMLLFVVKLEEVQQIRV